jgi:amino acid transporter
MWFCLLDILLTYHVGIASVSLGFSVYLKTLISVIQLPDNVIAIIVLCIAAAIASFRVELGALTTTGMVIIESVVLGIIIIAALVYPHQRLTDVLMHPVVSDGSNLTPVTFGIALPTLAATFSLIVGYEAVLGFSEELEGDYKTLIKATVITALLAITLVAVPIAASIIAAPNLISFFQSPTPVIDVLQQSFGSWIAKLVNFCILIALFTALLAGMMVTGRILYATGRDNIWWKGANNSLIRLNKQQVPSFAVVVSLCAIIFFAFIGALNWLIVFTASGFITMYFIVGFAGFWSRFKFPFEKRPYKMPFWPITPFFVMLFTLFAFISQEFQYQIGIIVLIVLALIFWGIKKTFPKLVP